MLTEDLLCVTVSSMQMCSTLTLSSSSMKKSTKSSNQVQKSFLCEFLSLKNCSLCVEILGGGGSGSEDSGSGSSGDESSEEDEEDEGGEETKMEIEDMTESKLLIIRRNIYLTIMSSAGHEECVHKLVKNLKEGSEVSSTYKCFFYLHKSKPH